MDNFQNILQGQRLKVEPITGVVVRGDRLRVAVDHDGFVTSLAERKGGMHTGVVKLDTLTDSVGPRAENHHFLAIRRHHLGNLVIARVVVRGFRRKFPGTGVDCLEHRADAHAVPQRTQLPLSHTAQGSHLSIGKTVLLPVGHERRGELSFCGNLSCNLIDQLDLIKEPRINPCGLMQLLHSGALPQCLLHGDNSSIRGANGLGDKFFGFERLLTPVEGAPPLL